MLTETERIEIRRIRVALEKIAEALAEIKGDVLQVADDLDASATAEKFDHWLRPQAKPDEPKAWAKSGPPAPKTLDGYPVVSETFMDLDGEPVLRVGPFGYRAIRRVTDADELARLLADGWTYLPTQEADSAAIYLGDNRLDGESITIDTTVSVDPGRSGGDQTSIVRVFSKSVRTADEIAAALRNGYTIGEPYHDGAQQPYYVATKMVGPDDPEFYYALKPNGER